MPIQGGLLRHVGTDDELDALQERAAGYDFLPVVEQAQDTVERQHSELTDRLARQVEETAARAGDWLAAQRRAWEEQLSTHMERLARQAAEALAHPQVPFPFSAPVPPGMEHLVGALQSRPGDILGAPGRAQQVAAAGTTVTPEDVESVVGGARGMVSGLAEVPGTVTRPAAAAAEAFGRGAYGEAALRAGEAGLMALPENLAPEAAARMAAGIVRESPRYGTEAQRLAAAPVVEEVVRQAAYAPALAEVGLGGVRAAGELAQVAPQVPGRVAAAARRAAAAAGEFVQAVPAGVHEAAAAVGHALQAAVPEEAYRLGITAAQPQPSAPAPPFYSQLQRVLEQKMPNRAPPAQVRAIASPANGVKPDELKWTGLDDWLTEKARAQQPVTKGEVLDFLRTNEVRVEEVVKGAPGVASTDVQIVRVAFSGGGEMWRVTVPGHELGELYPTRAEAQAAAQALGPQPPEYRKYTLPGAPAGTYRELLLTLPRRPAGPARAQALGEYIRNRFGADSPLTRAYERQGEAGLPPSLLEDVQRAMRAGFESYADEAFHGPHFDEPNVLAHVRFNDRVDAEGKRVLFLEEVQSDWHQAGREKGYLAAAPLMQTEEQRRLAYFTPGATVPSYGGGTDRVLAYHPSTAQEHWSVDVQAVNAAGVPIGPVRQHATEPDWASLRRGVPPAAPFAKTWPDLVMKRMVRWAAEHGYDRLAWTTGAQQVDRYDLARYVREIQWGRQPDGTYWIQPISHDGQALPQATRGSIPERELANYIGNNAAARVIQSPAENGTLTGEALQVGGEGMRTFYDRMLPEVANKLGKKWGSRVATTEITTTRPQRPVSIREGRGAHAWEVYDTDSGAVLATVDHHAEALELRYRLSGGFAEEQSVHALDITPAMRQSVLERGQPLFATAGPSLRGLEFGGVPAAPATAAEVAAGRAGAVVGGVLGATTEPEGAEAPPTPLERAGRAVTGALIGGTGAGAAVRLGGMAARGAEAVRAGEEVAAAAARGRLPRDVYLAGLRAREADRLQTRAEALRAGLEQRYARWEVLQQRLVEAETRLEAETSVTGIDRPAWAARRGSTRAFTDRELLELAAEQSRGMPNRIDPYVEGWGDAIDPAVVEQWRTERLSARTGTAAQAGMTPREQASAAQVLRAEVRRTRQELGALDRDVERQLGHVGLLEDRAAKVMTKAESAAGVPSGGGLPPATDDVQTVLRRVLAELGEVRAAAPAGTSPARRGGDVRAGQPIGRAIAAGVEAAPGETVAAASRADFIANVRLATFPEELRPFVRQAVDRLPVEAVDVARRGVLGEAAVRRLAGELGLTVEDFVRRARPGRTYSAEELIALDQTFAHTAAQIKEQSSRLASGAVTVADHDTARTELAALVLQATGLARAAVGARAEAGRALGAMRYLRQAVEAAPAAPQRLRRALQLIGDTDTLTPDLVQKLAAAADDPVELFSLVRQAQTPSWWERFSTYYRFNLLSNPLTQVRNLVGNTGAMAMVPVERLGAAVAEAAITPKTGAQAVGAALGAVGGGTAGGALAAEQEAGPLPLAGAIAAGAAGGLVAGRNIGTLVTLARGGRAALPERERLFAEVLTDAEGWAWAQALAWRRVGTILSRGYSDTDAVRMELRHKAITAGIGSQALARAVGVLELPFRALSAGDAYFATMAEYGELFTQAARQVREQGLTGTAARTELLRLVATPTAEMAAAAEHAASYRTYNQTLDGLGKWLRGPGAFMPAGRARDSANAAWSLVFPFVSTPYNIGKYELERSPLGALSVAKGALQGERGGALSDRIGRLLVGSAVFTAALWYAQDDNLTGAGPRSPAERDLWVREHRQPYSIRINGQWYSYAQLTGLSTTLALAAELAAAQKVSERGLPASTIVRAVWDAGRVATEKPYLQGMRRLEEAMANPDRAAALLEATAANVVPAAAALGAVARATDVEPQTGELVQRAPEGLLDRVAAGVPGLRAGVPERLTAFGRTATRTGGLQVGGVAVEPLVNPITRSEVQEDPIDRELRRLVEATGQGAGPAPVARTAKIAGQELTREQRQQLQQLSGPAAYEALAQLFLTGEYLRATSDARRVALVHGAIARARVEATEQLVPRALRQRAG